MLKLLAIEIFNNICLLLERRAYYDVAEYIHDFMFLDG